MNDQQYFDFLKNKVYGEFIMTRYDKLLKLLYDRAYIAVLWNDNRRLSECQSMRAALGAVLFRPISVLEVLISLADREEEILFNTIFGIRTAEWFWEMIGNMNLSHMNDAQFDIDYSNKVIDAFINRTYTNDNPMGCAFRSATVDVTSMQQIELWYQMCYSIDN